MADISAEQWAAARAALGERPAGSPPLPPFTDVQAPLLHFAAPAPAKASSNHVHVCRQCPARWDEDVPWA